MNVKILYEDKDVIVVVKPAGMPSQGDRSSTLDMVSYLKNYFACAGENNSYVGVIHRLDRPVGGVMVYAKNAQAAAKLSEQVRKHDFEKGYMAVLTGKLDPKEGILENYVYKDSKSNLSFVTVQNNPQAKKARLEYKTLDAVETEDGSYSLIDINLLTGRHHQIRVQTSCAGAGIYGDTKYNPKFKNKKGWYPMGLFSYKLSFEHPRTKKRLQFEEKPIQTPFDMFGHKEEI